MRVVYDDDERRLVVETGQDLQHPRTDGRWLFGRESVICARHEAGPAHACDPHGLVDNTVRDTGADLREHRAHRIELCYPTHEGVAVRGSQLAHRQTSDLTAS